MHTTIAEGIGRTSATACVVRTATLDDPEHGLTEEVLEQTDVLTWWGHAAHAEVADEVVERVHRHVLSGHGPGRPALRALVEDLHQAHGHHLHAALAQPSTTASWSGPSTRPTRSPQGVPHPLVIDEEEMYGEFFDIPAPDELVFISSFSGGEVFRSGCTFRRGHGKIFYFRPGDQDYPTYHHRTSAGSSPTASSGPAPTGPSARYPTLLRYETGDFFNGHGYTGPLERELPDSSPAATRQPLRVVVVGAGGMGRAWLARPSRRRPTCELVGIADLDLGRAPRRGGARAPGRPGRRRRRRARPATGAQAVINVTVPAAHHPVTTDGAVRRAAGAGREAGRADAVAEALSLAAAAEVSGELFMVSQSRRWNPQLFALRGLAAALGHDRHARPPSSSGRRTSAASASEMAHPLLVDMAIHAVRHGPVPARRGARLASTARRTTRPGAGTPGEPRPLPSSRFESGARYVYTGSWCSPGARDVVERRRGGSAARRAPSLWDGETSPCLRSGRMRRGTRSAPA